MATDNAIRDHQEWLGYLQPDGLVVSPAAMVDLQVILDKNAIGLQERFLEHVADVVADDHEASGITDFVAFVCEFLKWPPELLCGLDGTDPLPDSLIVPLPEFSEELRPTFAFKDPKPKHAEKPWLLLAKVLAPNADLDTVTPDAKWSATESRRFERLLRETGVPIGVLTNGTSIRLMYAPRGENVGTITFPIQAMAEVAGRSILGALHMLLSVGRLLTGPAEARLPSVLEKSRAYQSSVSAALAGQVLDALYELVRGFQAGDERVHGALLKEVLARNPDEVYGGLLNVLLRLVFLLYAEDRGLMPSSSLYTRNYSVHGLYERLREDNERYPDTMDHRFGAWAQLVALFGAVHGGCQHAQMRMPARKGYLFDPERYKFLEGRDSPRPQLPLVADGVVFRVLNNLLKLKGERLSYRTLDVEQIGSVYETMMGFRLEVATGPTIALKPAKKHGASSAINLEQLLDVKPAERIKWLKEESDQKIAGTTETEVRNAATVDDLLVALEKKIARNATPHPVSKGVMVLQPSDERRRSGSHYTPRSLTEPIVRTTLKPILEQLGKRPAPAQILDLKIADIAVGSGAFLVETCRQLGDELIKAWHTHKQTPVIPVDEDEVLFARRTIAQRCLYGVDRNPMAVDLAKLSLWLATLAKDHPFTFLDHSIRCGDSLVGLSKLQIAEFHWEEPGQPRVWGQDDIEFRVEQATKYRKELLEADEDLEPPELKAQRLKLADEQLNFVRKVGDCVIAAFFAGKNAKERKAKRDELARSVTDFYKSYDIEKSPDHVVSKLRSGKFPVMPFH